ncbi:Protein of unknown function [Pyronema omphalodes CBS 100304]|uniref:Uncharacterized protein n=1 Tax=Pyronema omphalodes (strain CBS 100304) TaxID=1076935 RepID=U4LC94_PYROM|nr:Protein of unknown function [Pyronema omphalodes CBS 100304]
MPPIHLPERFFTDLAWRLPKYYVTLFRLLYIFACVYMLRRLLRKLSRYYFFGILNPWDRRVYNITLWAPERYR